MPTQYEWLMQRLEPIEALALRAAKDAFMTQGMDTMCSCPLFWLDESECEEKTVSRHLFLGFVWGDSPQGKAYWQKLHDKYKRIEAQEGAVNHE